ncbi:MAG: hypothetical protein ACKVOU_11240 [Cytophagales bacterium]
MKFTTFVIIGMATVANSFAQKATSGEDLIRKMHKKYHNNFNANITFIQLNQDFDAAGKVTHSMSFEAFHYPGKFRNDKGPTPQKEGYIVAHDIMYEFKDGKIVNQKPCVMDVGLLTGDIYFMSVDKAVEECQKHGYNFAYFREDMFKGKPVYVVGAKDKADEKSPQFWIDQEELYVVRDINFSEEDNELEDIHFLEHAKVENAWVEERVEIFVNGKLVKKEHYAEVKANNELNLDIFDSKKVGTVHWRNK